MTKDTQAREAIRAIVKSVIVGSGHNDEERQAILAILYEPNEEPAEEPAVPDGWCRLKVGDKIERGDKYCHHGTWRDTEIKSRDVSVSTFAYIRKSPEIEILIGWEYKCGASRIESKDYILSCDGKTWESCTGSEFIGESVSEFCTTHATQVIRPKINIDMQKQPEELVAWAMDKDWGWKGYANEPDSDIDAWYDEIGGYTRSLLKSERPDYDGDWKDSLIVRPS